MLTKEIIKIFRSRTSNARSSTELRTVKRFTFKSAFAAQDDNFPVFECENLKKKLRPTQAEATLAKRL